MQKNREYHRVRLRLPVRLRWTEPLACRSEICETLDVSRGGLLVACEEAHAPGSLLWVTFPYDGLLPDGQPEISARVVRCGVVSDVFCQPNEAQNAHEQETDAMETGLDILERHTVFAIALCFEESAKPRANSNGHRGESERRNNPRSSLALPVRVRPEHVPWFEEAMTLDFSPEGIRFLSNRECQPGQRLLVSFESSARGSWSSGKEILAVVVRVESVSNSSTQVVSVSRLK